MRFRVRVPGRVFLPGWPNGYGVTLLNFCFFAPPGPACARKCDILVQQCGLNAFIGFSCLLQLSSIAPVNAMKSFARLFFAVGAALTAHLFLFPDTLKIVCIPGSPAPMALSAQHTSPKTVQPDNASASIVSDWNVVLLFIHWLFPFSVRTYQQIETVELLVNGVPYKFQLTSLDTEYVHSLAREFCLSHHAAESSSSEQLEAGCTQVGILRQTHRCGNSIIHVNTLPSLPGGCE